MNGLKSAAFAVLFFCCGFLANQTLDIASLADEGDAQRLALAKEVMTVAGFDSAAKVYMAAYARQAVSSWKSTLPSLKEGAEKALEEELTTRLVQEYLDLGPEITRVFAKHFSSSEMQGLLDFYRSPLGQTFLAKVGAYDEEVYSTIYPKIASSTERHWFLAIDVLRAQGKL
ncbi:DUF2059 domain-containing protein [Taklimakanibacter lacteus]|uniref:DUF2059 domain-containing protein n=1 Tax=Taklimakanibacter lacteus TaxID=2268456 RepID=UPI000E6703AE